MQSNSKKYTSDHYWVGIDVEYLPGKHIDCHLSRIFYNRELAEHSLKVLKPRFPNARVIHFEGYHNPNDAQQMKEYEKFQSWAKADRMRIQEVQS